MIGESSSASKCLLSSWRKKKRVLPQQPEANESAAHLFAGVPFWMHPSDGGWMMDCGKLGELLWDIGLWDTIRIYKTY